MQKMNLTLHRVQKAVRFKFEMMSINFSIGFVNIKFCRFMILKMYCLVKRIHTPPPSPCNYLDPR